MAYCPTNTDGRQCPECIGTEGHKGNEAPPKRLAFLQQPFVLFLRVRNMEEKRKTRGWLTWLVVGLALPPIYLLSLGPVAGLNNRGYLSDPIRECAAWFYAPAESVFEYLVSNKNLPAPIRDAAKWYVFLW